ncbi:hypothetical protein ACWDWU_30140 [Streptomyces sp. NPDC003442]
MATSTAALANDQVAGIGQLVVPGTPRDFLHVLDTVLNLDAGTKPEEMVAADNAFRATVPAGGDLRPLRDPASADTDEEG